MIQILLKFTYLSIIKLTDVGDCMVVYLELTHYQEFLLKPFISNQMLTSFHPNR